VGDLGLEPGNLTEVPHPDREQRRRILGPYAEGAKMQLEHLCDLELVYRHEPLYEDILKVAVPYDTLEASLCGRATPLSAGSASAGRRAG
jgi:hypothetical protein